MYSYVIGAAVLGQCGLAQREIVVCDRASSTNNRLKQFNSRQLATKVNVKGYWWSQAQESLRLAENACLVD
jgi:hypothetical protein